jgi:DNA-directed RNA polymerase subunit L
MKLKAVERGKDKLVVEIAGESHTFLNLLRETAWSKGASHAAYIIEHPYLSEPKISVKGGNPKNILKNSAQSVILNAKDFQKEFSRALKR